MELLKRDAEIAFLKRQLNGHTSKDFDQEYLDTMKNINSDMEFLEQCNIGGEFMKSDDQARVKDIGSKKIEFNGLKQNFLLISSLLDH